MPVDVVMPIDIWTILNSIYARARRRPCVTMFGFSKRLIALKYERGPEARHAGASPEGFS
jgi:hypothetical protein